MPLDPGKMRDRIRLQRAGEYDPWQGQTYETVGEFWAEFRAGSGREFREGSTIIGEERATFAVNYREGLRQIDRIVHLGRGGKRIWNIQSVAPTMLRRREYDARTKASANCRREQRCTDALAPRASHPWSYWQGGMAKGLPNLGSCGPPQRADEKPSRAVLRGGRRCH
jgi:head-tail adaptor